jgi:beta-lactamase class A
VKGRVIFFVILVCAVIFYVIGRENSKPNLHKTVLKALLGAKGSYSVSVENLKTKEKESLFGDKVFKVGSLYKLWIMGETFRQIQAGLLSEDEVLSEDVSVLNKDFNIDPESAELTDGTIVLTVRAALKQMIDISHNYAALLLTKKIKLSNVAEFLKTNGFNASHVGGTPTSTADDIALFYKKLYKGEFANKQYTLEMSDLLKAQTLNDKLPKYLPKGTVVAHKTGEIEYLSHDAGIIYTPNGDYIVVVLSESDYPLGAEERIAQISKSVFDYFSSQNK